MNNLIELREEDLRNTEGGILLALIGYVVNTSLVVGTVTAAALTVKGGFDKGYEAAQEFLD